MCIENHVCVTGVEVPLWVMHREAGAMPCCVHTDGFPKMFRFCIIVFLYIMCTRNYMFPL
jgi:hypothetical protein